MNRAYKCAIRGCKADAAEDSDYCGLPACPGNEPVLGDRIPSVDSVAARKKIEEYKVRAAKHPTDKLRTILDANKTNLAEHSKDGFAYLMIDAGMLWFSALRVQAISEMLGARRG